MKNLSCCKSTLKNNFRFSSTTTLLSLLFISGSLFAQNQVDSPGSSTSTTDTTKALEYRIPILVYDTIPQFYNRIWNLGFGLAFPLQDFHASDPQNPMSGYALQGVSLSTGLYLGFKEGSEAGWYFGAGYSSFRTAGFIDSLQASAASISALPTLEAGSVTIEEDYRPRYNIISLSTGFAFEGSKEEVSAYGALLLNVNFTNMNSFGLENTLMEEVEVGVPFAVSTGFSAKLGLRFQQQFNVGVAWHYLGMPEMGFDRPGASSGGVIQSSNPIARFASIPMARRIHFLEVHLGYAFIKRGGYRPPRVNVSYIHK